MQKQKKKEVTPFDSIALQLNAMKAADVERRQIQELLNSPEHHCAQCKLEHAISSCLKLATTRNELLLDKDIELTEDQRMSLTDERNELIKFAHVSAIQLKNVQQMH